MSIRDWQEVGLGRHPSLLVPRETSSSACGAFPCPLQSLSMLTESNIRTLLQPFGLTLTSAQVGQILTHLELLLRWNRKINLTAIRSPEACLTRHFGESLYLARWVRLEGRLLDIGSGAGFPGLALKIAAPSLSVTLLEPTAKKRVFLKEVARVCSLAAVEVREEHLEDSVNPAPAFDLVTARAIGRLESLIPAAARCLVPGGRLCLWLGGQQLASLPSQGVEWSTPIPVPLSRDRKIVIGTRA